MGATVGPRVSAAREYVAPGVTKVRGMATDRWDATVAAVAPLMIAAREGAKEARHAQLQAMKKQQKKSSGRWTTIAALVAAGAAVGASAAYILRRRRQQWAEYDPGKALEPVRDKTKSTVDKATETVDSAAEKTRETVDKTTSSAQSSAHRAANKVKESTDDLVRKAGSPGRNSRG